MVTSNGKTIGRKEFIALMAVVMSLTALTTDAMLPALHAIGVELQVATAADTQLIISVMFIGIALGQIALGPLADSLGRKPTMLIGIGIFLIGSVLTIVADDFGTMMVGRLIQGLGMGAPRVLCMAIIRDQFRGREMAQITSNIMSIFILVPMLAPMFGQSMLFLGEWRLIFAAIFVFGLCVGLWFYLRMPETLSADNKVPFSLSRITRTTAMICRNRAIMLYTLATGLVFSGFVAYLSSSATIFQSIYKMGDSFALIFAAIALGIGIGSHMNSRLVMRFGMAPIVYAAAMLVLASSLIYMGATLIVGTNLPLWCTCLWLVSVVFCNGLVFGNLNAMAMEPLEKNAGIGSMVVGMLSTLISVPLGAFVARSMGSDMLPLAIGFFVFYLVALLVVKLAGRFSEPVTR